MNSTLRFHRWFTVVAVVGAALTLSSIAHAEQLNLAGAPTFMSSAETPGLSDTNALWDGDRGTRIATGDNLDDPPGGDGNDNEWFYVDLGQTYILEEIRIDWEAAFGQDYDIYVSNTDPGGTTNPSDPIWGTPVATVIGFDQDGEAPPNHGGEVDNIIDFRTGTVDLVTDLGGVGVGSAVVAPEGQYVMIGY